MENGVPHQQPLASLREYLATEIMPHAEAEERTLYQAAVTHARAGELVRTLTAEHRELASLAGRLQRPDGGPAAATVAEWIATLFASHVAKETISCCPRSLTAVPTSRPLSRICTTHTQGCRPNPREACCAGTLSLRKLTPARPRTIDQTPGKRRNQRAGES